MKKFIAIGVIVLSFINAALAQRNVVVIIADDLGTDYFGFYADHGDTVDVPNIRALLKRGITFTNAMSNPVCSSTRSTILTGRYAFSTGVGNIVGGSGGSGELDTNEISIPKMLNFYRPSIAKANIGKWHLNGTTPSYKLLSPLALGYNHYEGPFIGQLNSYTNWTKYTNGVSSNVTNYATSENVDNAVSWLRKQNADQYFIWLGFNAPHIPLHLPPTNLHTYKSLSGNQVDINKNPKSYFKAMIQAMDTEIGRMMDSLKVLNRYDSTDFVFIGDNGNTDRTAQIADTNRAKGTIYQYGTHVPFIISGPSVINPNRTSDALVNVVDIFATTLELMGFADWANHKPTTTAIDSKSLYPIVLNTKTSVRNFAFSENFKLIPDSQDGKAIRNMKYKLLRFDNGKEEFYNLEDDPNENLNLLSHTLTVDEYYNYKSICMDLSLLTNGTIMCSHLLGVATIDPIIANQVSPNPFTNHILYTPVNGSKQVILVDQFGRLIYEGSQIESVDFSYLSKGIYFLKTEHNGNHSYKLIKE